MDQAAYMNNEGEVEGSASVNFNSEGEYFVLSNFPVESIVYYKNMSFLVPRKKETTLFA